MSPRLRNVTADPRDTAVQILRKHWWKLTTVERLGPVDTSAEVNTPFAACEKKLAAYGQPNKLELDPPIDDSAPPRAKTVVRSRSSVLIDTVGESCKRLGFGKAVNDPAFFRLLGCTTLVTHR